MAFLKIVRPKKAWQDAFRAYTILLDDVAVGKIRPLGEVLLRVTPGRHTIQCRVDWCRSQRIEVDVAEGATEVVACMPNAHPLLAVVYVLFLRSRYIRLIRPTGTA